MNTIFSSRRSIASSIGVRWPRCWSSTSVGRVGTRRTRGISMATERESAGAGPWGRCSGTAGSMVLDAEFRGGPGGGALVASADRDALALRLREQLAGEREHNPLFDQAEFFDPVAPQR